MSFAAAAFAGPAAAQVTLTRSTIAAGAPAAAHGSATLRSTVGQAVIGRSSHVGGSLGAGFWYRAKGTATSIPQVFEAESSPLVFRLRPNAPNPFGPLTRIHFELPRDEHVRLRIVSVDGRVVATLVDGRIPAGAHEVLYRPGSLSSGVYYYRLEAGNEVRSGRMVLAR